jgi:subtilisin-like proprotein convertase family protein
VAFYSSRGNTGIGVEGEFGRFKPDVVAPGSWVVSTRSTNWTDPTSFGDLFVSTRENEQVAARGRNTYSIAVPPDGVTLYVVVRPNTASPQPFPDLPIKVSRNPLFAPIVAQGTNVVITDVTEGNWYYSVENPTSQPVSYDLFTFLLVTNAPDTTLTVLKTLNDKLAPNYRYESGTSMSAPAITGMLALMQELFERRLKITNSPAMMKALLINGSRTVSGQYDFEVNRQLGANDQGWGLPTLPAIIPAVLGSATNADMKPWPVHFYDQSASNAVATGQSQTREITLSEDAKNFPLRITLVWTDPPGNPAAGVKLVNDLDLVVTNLDSVGTDNLEVYVGNNFQHGTVFTAIDTNAPTDVINNVENIYIDPAGLPLGSRYSVTVRGKRVNVNAVPEHQTGIVQDYALVISTDNKNIVSPFSQDDQVIRVSTNGPSVTVVTNGLALLNQHVGANSPLLPSSIGATNQWTFFVFTNAGPKSGTNVAFTTFFPPNASRSRIEEADIDMYVSTDPRLLQLDPAVINGIPSNLKSTNRGGTETVILTGEARGKTYFVGIKSEDQQAAEFGFFAVGTDQPFSGRDKDGNLILYGILENNGTLPDGSPSQPQAGFVFVFSPENDRVHSVIVTNTITHQLGGDIFAQLNHAGKKVVLASHISFGNEPFVRTVTFDDTLGGTLNGLPTTGPGSLNDFIAQRAAGMWMMTLVENAIYHTGAVNNLTLKVIPQTNDLDKAITVRLGANQFYYDFVDVPAEATNLSIIVTYNGAGSTRGPIDVYLRPNQLPTVAAFDKFATFNDPGGKLSLGIFDAPPLLPDNLYYILFHNNTANPVEFTYIKHLDYDLRPINPTLYTSSNNIPLLDNAITDSIISVTNNQRVAEARVAVRIDHPRISDLVLHLVSPQGTRLLLSENRGGPFGTAYGTGTGADIIYTVFTDNTNLATLPIKYASAPFAPAAGTGGSNVVFKSDFDAAVVKTYGVGTGPETWVVQSNSVAVMQSTAAQSPSRYLALADGTIRNSVALTAGQGYVLDLGVRQPMVAWFRGENNALDSIGVNHGQLNGMAFTPGEVGQAFSFNGFNGFVSVPASSALDVGKGPGFSVDAWINPTDLSDQRPIVEWNNDAGFIGTHFWLSVFSGSAGVNGNLFANLVDTFGNPHQIIGTTGVLTSGVLQHVALTFDKATSTAVIYHNGVAVGSTNFGVNFTPATSFNFYLGKRTSGPATGALFQGLMDEVSVYDCALSDSEINSIYRAGAAGKGTAQASVLVDGKSITVAGSSLWTKVSVPFSAGATNAAIELQGQPFGLHFDSFAITGTGQAAGYFFPEEPLSLLKGELALGNWRLEAWDNRSQFNATILDWQLQLIFPPSFGSAEVVTNGVAITNVVNGNEMKYFAVDVPFSARFATNILISLSGGPLDLVFNQSGLPQRGGTPSPGDINLLTGTGGGIRTLTTNGAPPLLVPGQRYYLGIRNSISTQTNQFVLQVNFDRLNVINVTPLTNGVSLSTNISGSVSDLSIQYFQFDVSSDAVAAAFEVLNPSGDVDLILRRGPFLPDLRNFDYGSANVGTNNEIILVGTNSAPIALTPGRWYLGVYNVTSNAVAYSVRATEFQAGGTNTVINNISEFFVVDVPADAVRATNSLTSLTGGALDLVFNQSGPPATGTSGNVTLLAGITNNASRVLVAGSGIPPLAPGQRYYVAVRNNSGLGTNRFTFAVSFERSGVVTNTGPTVTITVDAANICLTWDSEPGATYIVQGRQSLSPGNPWTDLQTVPATGTTTQQCFARPTPYQFFRVVRTSPP